MPTDLEQLERSAAAEIEAATEARAVEQLRVELLGKKGRVTELLKQLGGMAPEQRKAFGEQVNRVKETLGLALERRAQSIGEAELARRLASETIDVTLPGRGEEVGALHP